MRTAHYAFVALTALAVFGCSGDSLIPSQPSLDGGRRPRVVHRASAEIRFFIPADFNGGIFGGAVDNRLKFHARRDANGNVSGRFNYRQTDFGTASIPYTYKGSVTCFKVYDTPVLARFPDIPPMIANRAKWGGPIEETDDPGVAVGTFGWFQSIDNGRGGDDDDDDGDDDNGEDDSHPDLSTLFGLGDEAANEAFCNSPNVPNTNFGPHAVRGNIQVR